MSFVNYNQLPDSTRVWIYQSSEPIAEDLVPKVKAIVQQFVTQWVSHNQKLSAFGDLLHNRFLILMVDEAQAGASGCSIDKSVGFVKALQAELGVDFFDRMRFSFQSGDDIYTLSREEFSQWYQEGKINEDTLVFDTLVKDKHSLDHNFLKPMKESWHARMV